jgi:hypothetical protein
MLPLCVDKAKKNIAAFEAAVALLKGAERLTIDELNRLHRYKLRHFLCSEVCTCCCCFLLLLLWPLYSKERIKIYVF